MALSVRHTKGVVSAIAGRPRSGRGTAGDSFLRKHPQPACASWWRQEARGRCPRSLLMFEVRPNETACDSGRLQNRWAGAASTRIFVEALIRFVAPYLLDDHCHC